MLRVIPGMDSPETSTTVQSQFFIFATLTGLMSSTTAQNAMVTFFLRFVFLFWRAAKVVHDNVAQDPCDTFCLQKTNCYIQTKRTQLDWSFAWCHLSFRLVLVHYLHQQIFTHWSCPSCLSMDLAPDESMILRTRATWGSIYINALSCQFSCHRSWKNSVLPAEEAQPICCQHAMKGTWVENNWYFLFSQVLL